MCLLIPWGFSSETESLPSSELELVPSSEPELLPSPELEHVPSSELKLLSSSELERLPSSEPKLLSVFEEPFPTFDLLFIGSTMYPGSKTSQSEFT
jgi:hypothetical protein